MAVGRLVGLADGAGDGFAVGTVSKGEGFVVGTVSFGEGFVDGKFVGLVDGAAQELHALVAQLAE